MYYSINTSWLTMVGSQDKLPDLRKCPGSTIAMYRLLDWLKLRDYMLPTLLDS